MQVRTRDGRYETRGANPLLPWGSTVPPTNGQLGQSVAGTVVSEQTAMQLAAVWGSVSLIADSIATLPLRQYRATGPAEAVEVDPSPVVAQPYQPWPEFSRADFITQGTYSFLLRGNVFGKVISRDDLLYPEQVQLVHPDHARVRRLSDGSIEVRYWNQVVGADDVTRAMALSPPEGLVGLNPIEALRNVLGVARAQDLYAGAFFANQARPDGVIQVPGDLDDNETKAMRASWLEAHQGIGASHLPAVLTGGAEFKPISMNLGDVQFLEQMQFSASVISGLIFRVPPHLLGMVDKTTSWGCLPGDSLVMTTSGPRPIADIEAGDEVWSLGETGMQPAKVVAQRMTGIRPVLTFRTTGRTVRATANHHMVVRRWSKPGQGRRDGRWDTLLVDASDVRVGDHLVVPHGFTDGDRTVAPPGRPLTVEAMELAGLYIGDGSRDKNRVEIAHEADAVHMSHYRAAIRSEFGVESYVDPRGTRTRFSSAEAIGLLVDGGFGGTALTKRVPGWVFRLAPELQLAFLRGYLDSDGSVQHGRIIYTSANRLLLEDVRHLCIGLGIPAGRVVAGRLGGPGVIRGRAHQSRQQWRLSLSSVSHNVRIGSNSPTKAGRLDATPTTRRLRYDAGWRPRNAGMPPVTDGWGRQGCTFHRVTRIDGGSLAVPVYDIEVADTHTFVADGVVVGNSGIEQQEIGFVRGTLLPWLCRWEDLFTSWLPPGQFALFDLSKRLRGDTAQRWAAYQVARAIGAMTSLEIRKAEGMAPVVGDDTDALGSFSQPFNSMPKPLPPTQEGDKAN